MKASTESSAGTGGTADCAPLQRLRALAAGMMDMKLPPLEPPFRAPPGTLDAFAGSLAVAGDTILRVVERAAESACSGTAIRRGMLLASLETWEWRYEYDEKGRRKSAARVDRATGRVLEITHYYYSLDRLSWEETSAGGKVIRQVHYEYERDGRLRSWTLHEVDYDGDIPVRVREYEFDAQDRLLRERVIEIPRER